MAQPNRSKARIREKRYAHSPKGKYRAMQYRIRSKLKVMDHYGGRKCSCCGETIYEFLTLDHPNGNGKEQRETIGFGLSFYRWLKRNGYPPGLRVLCWNCNLAYGLFGYCPHKSGGINIV